MRKIVSKSKDSIYIYPVISTNHRLYNYIVHITNFLRNIKYRKYNLTIKILEPKNNTNIISNYNIYSFPSFILKKNDKYIIYNGTNINELENKLNDLLN